MIGSWRCAPGRQAPGGGLSAAPPSRQPHHLLGNTASVSATSERVAAGLHQRTPAYVSIRQHTSAYVTIRHHTSPYVSIRQHTSPRHHTSPYVAPRRRVNVYVNYAYFTYLTTHERMQQRFKYTRAYRGRERTQVALTEAIG
jgi:hypothetical protein